MTRKSAAAISVAVAAAVVIASVAVVSIYYRPGPTSSPGALAGTDLLAPGVVASSLGGNWSEKLSAVGGGENPLGLLTAYAALSGFPLNTTGTGSNYSAVLAGSSQLSTADYSQQGTGANLMGAVAFLPNATIASEIFTNLTTAIESDSSLSFSQGQIGSSNYILANATSMGNETQLILTESGRNVVLFVYAGITGVSGSAMTTLASDQLQVLGSGSTVAYPSQLVSFAQLNTTIGPGFNSEIYAAINTTDLGALWAAVPAGNLSVNSTGSFNASSLSPIEMQYLDNITGLGLAVFGGPASNGSAFSSFVSFNASTYSVSLYEELDLVYSSSSNYTYHNGTIGSSPYFYIAGNLSANSTGKISLVFCLENNSILVDGVLGSSVTSYSPLVALTTDQIADLAS
ncbi:MAG: hypothetical protein HKL79_03225 [Thermoplasmata archaeon]|nr:hypothetical protein [Thermoplasmata archaeon]